MAVAAVVDEPGLGVESLELAAGQVGFDGGEDPVAVGPDGLGQSHQGRDPAAARPGQSPVQVVGVGESVEVA